MTMIRGNKLLSTLECYESIAFVLVKGTSDVVVRANAGTISINREQGLVSSSTRRHHGECLLSWRAET